MKQYGKIMSDDEMRRYIDSVGRAELFEEIEDLNNEYYDFVRGNNGYRYPRYLKAIRVSLVAQGYDQQWVEDEFRKALDKKYLGEDRSHEREYV